MHDTALPTPINQCGRCHGGHVLPIPFSSWHAGVLFHGVAPLVLEADVRFRFSYKGVHHQGTEYQHTEMKGIAA